MYQTACAKPPVDNHYNCVLLNCRCTSHFQTLQGTQNITRLTWYTRRLSLLYTHLFSGICYWSDRGQFLNYVWISYSESRHVQESTIYLFKRGLYGARLLVCEFLAPLAWRNISITNLLESIFIEMALYIVRLIDFMRRHYIKLGFLWTSRRSLQLARCAVGKLTYS